jgi:DNA-binding PadR family transcriptional regulator
MQPFERFKKLNTEGNLWVYILLLAREEEVTIQDISRLTFERFDFLPAELFLRGVLFRLRNKGYVSSERFKGKSAYKTTKKGLEELEKVKSFCKELAEKI